MRESQNQAWIVTAIVARLPDVVAVYQFGTWGTPYQRPESDIDLAVLPAAPVPAMVRWELAQELASGLGRDVDLVDLLTASTVMRAQVIAHCQRLYCGDATACGAFETYVFSSYARLNEERHAILRDIQNRGRIYGR